MPEGLTRRAFAGMMAAAGAAGAAGAGRRESVQTVTGATAPQDLGVTLSHEHIVTDLRSPAERVAGDYDREDAVRTALPYLQALRAAGCGTLVEPTPIGIGRDPAALKRLSELADLKIVCATGIYGAANQRFIPDQAREESAERLAEGYLREIEEGIGDSGVRPGLIKTGVNRETPLPQVERKLVRAAALAGARSGLTVASHTGPAAPALEQLGIIAKANLPPSSFIWVHSQNEPDAGRRVELAREGVWVSLDGVRPQSAEVHLEGVKRLAYAGLLGRVLISQDAGWYRPGAERGSNYRGYTYLLEQFVPLLRRAGFSAVEVEGLLVRNPARALTGAL